MQRARKSLLEADDILSTLAAVAPLNPSTKWTLQELVDTIPAKSHNSLWKSIQGALVNVITEDEAPENQLGAVARLARCFVESGVKVTPMLDAVRALHDHVWDPSRHFGQSEELQSVAAEACRARPSTMLDKSKRKGEERRE